MARPRVCPKPKPLIYAEKIEWVPIGQLKPSPRNARTHSKKQIKQIARSIERFGFLNPILVDEDLYILAGHGRKDGAELLRWPQVPVVRITHLTEDEKRAYVLADNQIATKAGWHYEFLQIELQGLIDRGFDINVTGFEAPEIDFILDLQAEAADDLSPEDHIPEYRKGPAVTQIGEVWILDKHRLICMDACEPKSYRALLSGKKGVFVFTDPPYNVRIQRNVSGRGRIRHGEFAMASGEMSWPEYTNFLERVFSNLAANTTDGSIHDFCMDWRHLPEILAAGARVYGEPRNVCVWVKKNAGMGSFYRSQHEFIFIFKNGSAAHINNFELGQHGRSRSNVWNYAGVNSFKADRRDELELHPTVKPAAMVADAIKDCSRRGDIVLDPFVGSGTTIIAAERTGRCAYAMEIDPHYCDVTVRRWQTFTGKTAVLASTRETFEEREEQAQATLPPRARRAAG